MSPETLKVLDMVIRVALYGAIYFVAWVAFLSPLPLWNKYKKNRDKEKKEAERIIVKMNEDIKKDTASISVLKEILAELDKKLAAKKKELESLDPDDSNQDKQDQADDSNKLTITVNELRLEAKEKRIKGFSRMNREKLLQVLGY